jgi:GDP-L-fucose synthase
MRVTVTGGNGFLGRHVVKALQDAEHEVAAPSSKDYDLRNGLESMDLLGDTKPDVVVHLAARVGGIGDNVSHPGAFLYENAMMGLQLMENARRLGVSKFVTVGTACMYPDNAAIPMEESHIWDGLPSVETGPYAHAKRLVLAQGLAYADDYDFNSVFLVPSNLYGPGDTTTHVIPQLTRKFRDAILTGDDVSLWGTGQVTRDFLYVEDAAKGVQQAVDYLNNPWPVNLGTGVETPIYAVAAAIAYELGFEGRIHWDITKPEGAPRRALSTKRAHMTMSWGARTTLHDGLPRWLEWASSRP